MASAHDVQDYLEARRHAHTNPEAFQVARRRLLVSDKTEVLAQFEGLLKADDEEDRCRAIEGLVLLYGSDATEMILRSIHDESSTVRWVVCGCLHDYGDERAVPALLKRLKQDADCQVRGAAARALGEIGAGDVLPHLHIASRSDFEVDVHGHTPSSSADSAMTSILRRWVTRQIAGTPLRVFQETVTTGQLRGAVTAESIPFDPEGRINRTPRYSHVPISAFGSGWSSKLNLQTTLIAPFEVSAEYLDPNSVIQRIFIYHPIEDDTECDWAVHTILDPAAMNSPARPDAG